MEYIVDSHLALVVAVAIVICYSLQYELHNVIQFPSKLQLFLVISSDDSSELNLKKYKTTQQSNNGCKVLSGSPLQGFW